MQETKPQKEYVMPLSISQWIKLQIVKMIFKLIEACNLVELRKKKQHLLKINNCNNINHFVYLSNDWFEKFSEKKNIKKKITENKMSLMIF